MQNDKKGLVLYNCETGESRQILKYGTESKFFKDDLSDLYNTDLSDYEFGAVRAEKNSPKTIGHKYFEENKNDYKLYLYGNCYQVMSTGEVKTLSKNTEIPKASPTKFFKIKEDFWIKDQTGKDIYFVDNIYFFDYIYIYLLFFWHLHLRLL